MIKYYDTEAAYKADSKSDFESQVSLIGASNEVKYDGRSVVVGLQSAKTGSIAVLDGLHALHFIAPDTFSSKSFMSNYETVGVVGIGVDHPDFRGQVAILGKEFSSEQMFCRWYLKLAGYTLDGAERTGVLSIRQASDSWAANHDYTITYKADNVVALVAQLNAYFKANEPFVTQDWVAEANEDGSVVLHLKYDAWQIASYDGGKSGFSTSGATAPGWKETAYMQRRNGTRYGEGTITNMPRALAYFRNDNQSMTYNPATDVKSKKVGYPICLPGYLGTSQYQSDHCAFLRSIYGEGEEGWKKFMEGFLPVLPSEYGVFNVGKYGTEKQNTYYLASLKYRGQDGVEHYASPAARKVADFGFDHAALAKGQWVMGRMERIFSIVGQLRYPTTNDSNADPINKGYYAIGAPALSNNANVWSCSRCYSGNGWIADGGNGFAGYYGLYGRYLAVPLVLLDVPPKA